MPTSAFRLAFYAQYASGLISIAGGGTANVNDTVDVSCTTDGVTDPIAARVPVHVN